jgi:hypothetical protein
MSMSHALHSNNPMKIHILIMILFCSVTTFAERPHVDISSVYTQSIRGQMLRHGSPLSNYMMILQNESGAYSTPSLSDSDGMYYFYDIPPGEYKLIVYSQFPYWSDGKPVESKYAYPIFKTLITVRNGISDSPIIEIDK